MEEEVTPRSSPFKPAYLPAASLMGCLLLCLGACSGVPSGQPVSDPSLQELLRPHEPIAEEELIRGSDRRIYYTATLHTLPSSGFKDRYLEELEDRGFSIREDWTSPHSPAPRRLGYTVTVVQEERLRPYSIRYKSVWEAVDRDTSLLFRLRWNYPAPIWLTGRRLVFCLPEEFLSPWKTAVVIPEQNLVAPPFDLPLPPTAVVQSAEVDTERGRTKIDVIAKIPPGEVFQFYKASLAGGAIQREKRSDRWWVDLREENSVRPPWLPAKAKSFFVFPEDILFSKDGIAFRDARHAFYRPAGQPDSGQYQPKTLRNLPADAYRYVVGVTDYNP